MKKLLSALLALAIAAPLPPALAQAQERTPYSQAELDQMLAPIALYPDPLLSQVLMAATYPLEIVEAARWSRARPGLQGDEAVRGAQDQDWDPSVKSLLAFPKLLARMDEQLDWTKRLGDAFLEQEPHVMETVQQLRRKARAAGELAGDERQRVVDDGGSIAIEPANPQVVYVPYYDPLVVYGSWWWPGYPPVAWAPWPGYVVYRPGFWWGVGVGLSAGFFFGNVSWTQRHVTVVRVTPYYLRPPVVRRTVVVHRPIVVGNWRHDSSRRVVVRRATEAPQRVVPAAPVERRIEPREIRRDEHRNERRDDRRGHAMPPALRASPPAVAHARPQAPQRAAAVARPAQAPPRFGAESRERGNDGNRSRAEVRFGRGG
jgi:Protein of unknown function (DUF3300)